MNRPRLHSPLSAREIARRVLFRIEKEGAFSNLALAAELKQAPGLSHQDRALATELVYGVLKQRLRLRRSLLAYAERGDLSALPGRVQIMLEVAAYQVLFLTRVPAYAAVNDAVEATKRGPGGKLAGFANALLRALVRNGEPPISAELGLVERLEIETSAPNALVKTAIALL